MNTFRDGADHELTCWRAPTEEREAEQVATLIDELAKAGFRYRDIAILVRASTSYDRLLDALREHGIPVQPGGRTGLFVQPDAQLFGQTFAFLAGHDWRAEEYGTGHNVSLTTLVELYKRLFRLSAKREANVRQRLGNWKVEVTAETEPANLIRDYYDLLADCGV